MRPGISLVILNMPLGGVRAALTRCLGPCGGMRGSLEVDTRRGRCAAGLCLETNAMITCRMLRWVVRIVGDVVIRNAKPILRLCIQIRIRLKQHLIFTTGEGEGDGYIGTGCHLGQAGLRARVRVLQHQCGMGVEILIDQLHPRSDVYILLIIDDGHAGEGWETTVGARLVR